MINKLIIIWCLSHLYFQARAGQSSQYFKQLLDGNLCNFDVPRNIYNVSDLLRCMDEFIIDFFAQNNGRSLRQSSQSDSNSAYEKNQNGFSYMDLILNLFNSENPTYQDFSINSAVNYYQLNYPNILNAPSDQFSGFRIYLLDALSSISRYDDLKCVPRILCEAGSGKPLGEYKQASTYLEGYEGNALTSWLAGFDVAETSPVLNFVRAAALGYSSRGNPATCFRTFPRCPRDPGKLVHYLNNHNGGFFRFFSRHGQKYPLSRSPYASQGNLEFLRGRKRKALPPGYAGAEADRTGTGELKFDISVLSARQDYGKSFFPKENTLESSRRVVFPVHEELNGRPSENRILKSLVELHSSDTNTFSQDSLPFFPQESESEDVRELHLNSQLSDLLPRTSFQFPR